MIFEKFLESPFIFVLFVKGKQNKKETPKCDSLFGKNSLRKTKSGLGGWVTYWEGTMIDSSTLLSPKNYVSTD